MSMPHAHIEPVAKDVYEYFKEVLASETIGENQEPVSWLMYFGIRKFNGKLNPLKLRPLALVSLYGHKAPVKLAENFRQQLKDLEAASTVLGPEDKVAFDFAAEALHTALKSVENC